MLRGFYTAASGMYAQQRKTEMLTNNMANVNTAGFKEDQAAIRAFPEMLLSRFETNGPSGYQGTKQVGAINTGVYMQETMPRFIQGDLRQTDRQTDLALTDLTDNPVFFAVANGDETKYTRDGRFTVDANGLLTTSTGWPVLDTNGNQITVTSDQFTVDALGNIAENGVFVARLQVVTTEDPQQLVKEGSGLFRTADEEMLEDTAAYRVSQGFIEAANVDPTKAMTDMLTAYRAFEANQKILQAYDRSMEKTVNEIGRVN